MSTHCAGSATADCLNAFSIVCIASLWLLSSGHALGFELAAQTLGERAFVITDPKVLEPFTFEKVIVALGSTPSDDWLAVITTTGSRTEPALPVIIPMAGFIATPHNSYWWPQFAQDWTFVRPIAVVNRFDLAPADYLNCGEYRLIFSRTTSRGVRLHLAFEIVLPNPAPLHGDRGCASVAAFWWSLTGTVPREVRRDKIEHLFFHGTPSIPPALDRKTFEISGRIRTVEIGRGRPTFGQFEITRECTPPQRCGSRLTRVPLDNMPVASLFDGANTDSRAASFQSEFVRQVASLAIPDANRYFMKIDREYSIMDADALVPPFNYRLPFRRGTRTARGGEFRERIAEELRRLGSPLTPEDIIDRAETQNCVGCHGKSGPVGGGLVFPSAFEDGAHLSDRSLTESARLSPALQEVFIPYRVRVLRNYLRAVEP